MTLKSRIKLLKGDITKVTADAIVNAANSSLMGGGGVDGAIHRAGGPAILEDCRKIVARQGGCKTGEAVVTTAGNLNAKFVIHTVGPVWNGGKNREAELLAACYRNSLTLAVENGCKSIAFPCISTGIYRYPTNDAAKIAVDTVSEFLMHSDDIDQVTFACFDDDNYYWTKSKLNYRVYTISSRLLAGDSILGTVEVGLEDDGMGVLSGILKPTDAYTVHREFLRRTFTSDRKDNIIQINEYTKRHNFIVMTEDGTVFKDPVAGLIIYDFESEPIVVELAGISSDICSRYFL